MANVVGDPTFFDEWKGMREQIYANLFTKDKNWSFDLKQIGIFSFTSLNKAQSEYMMNKWHVYIIEDGCF